MLNSFIHSVTIFCLASHTTLTERPSNKFCPQPVTASHPKFETQFHPQPHPSLQEVSGADQAGFPESKMYAILLVFWRAVEGGLFDFRIQTPTKTVSTPIILATPMKLVRTSSTCSALVLGRTENDVCHMLFVFRFGKVVSTWSLPTRIERRLEYR